MSEERAEVLVLGAGIAGCALAYHLTEAQVGPVVVFDPKTPAAGASGRAAGVVTEQLWNEWDVQVVRESHAEYAALCRRWDPGAYRRTGFVRWTHRPEAREVLEEAVGRLHAWRVDVRLRDSGELAERLPEGRFDEGALALDSPNDACVEPTALTGIYAEGARQAGARFELGAPARSLAWSDGWWSLDGATTPLRSRRLVLAAGAWTKSVATQLGRPLPLTPYRTQAALLRPTTPARPEMPVGHDIDEDVYLRPEVNGRILVGNGTEKVEADPDRFVAGGDERFVEHIATVLTERWPRFGDAELAASWAGVCTSTPDRRPLIGPVDASRGLYAITGFNGFGIMRAGAAAARLARLLSSGESTDALPAELAPVDPRRFTPPYPSIPPRPGFTLEGGSDPRF
ncbi:MAG TPA: FAD-dependent oxidoreductase [Thermoplasmata archaeon]|nr:FAD-dependent oxidoreductase [Thermoplasmata archaeon]